MIYIIYFLDGKYIISRNIGLELNISGALGHEVVITKCENESFVRNWYFLEDNFIVTVILFSH